MLVGFLLVCATVLAKDSGKTACVASNTNCASGLDTAGCKTCAGAEPDQTCLDCKVSGQNVQLDKRSCAVGCPLNSAANDQKVCVCDQGFSLNDGKTACVSSGTNKSNGLSTGAIAGIVVAAVIVIGGLVGFLCWWFLCRGKA
ncbi:VSP [Giardia duodenalis]|uniref:VSP n=1 Tax=Giardia intestinalis (strain ATCC 50803 / WB clone C6) TaxID=184922 RepID=A8BNZ4_GIAIC|nr:VSP [Giardia intestinalis]KAE8304652.1 VSP [Giardia intestinalis]|eukprot:XP_001705829.1 VSP [Giardia lamblia ATCC 50803]